MAVLVTSRGFLQPPVAHPAEQISFSSPSNSRGQTSCTRAFFRRFSFELLSTGSPPTLPEDALSSRVSDRVCHSAVRAVWAGAVQYFFVGIILCGEEGASFWAEHASRLRPCYPAWLGSDRAVCINYRFQSHTHTRQVDKMCTSKLSRRRTNGIPTNCKRDMSQS